MPHQIKFQATAVINANAKDVYNVIADYHNGHPHIIPPENFENLIVEKGGIGAGTIIRFTTKAFGVKSEYHQIVSEPEPGHILVEQDLNKEHPLTTTFTVTPVDDTKSTVNIQTTTYASPGLTGLIERILLPAFMPSVYIKEMHLLEKVAQKHALNH